MPSRKFRSEIFNSTGRVELVGSRSSCPAMMFKIAAQSSAERAIGPILSIEKHSAIAPARGTRPYVGRSPLTLQNAPGTVIEPHVSVPIANPTSPPPTAAPEPLLDLPAQRDSSNGHLHAPVMDAPQF